MPRKKKFEVKVNVSLPVELADWLNDMIDKGVFANVSHGVRRCVAIAKTYVTPELEPKIEKFEDEEDEIW